MSNPMQSEREKLIVEIGIKLDAYGMGTVSEVAEKRCLDALADYILQREASLTPLADLNDPQYFLSSVSDPVDKFNLFIKKWCLDYPHLIDSDQNDGQAMRDMLAALTPQGGVQTEPVLTPKSTTKTLNLHKAGRGKPDGNHEAFTVVEEPKSTEPTRKEVLEEADRRLAAYKTCPHTNNRAVRDRLLCENCGLSLPATPQDSTASKESE